jgi:hypothetical protein
MADILSTNSSLSAAASAFEDLITAEEDSGKPATEPTKQAKQPDPEPEEGEEEGDEAQSAEEEAPEAKAGGEEAEEGDDDDGEDADTDEEQEPVYQVRIAGQEVEVPLSELVKGYSRTADYTRKTQDLAEERKRFIGEAQQTRELRDQYAQRLEQVQALLQQAEPKVNWDQLRAEDPIEFAAQWADHQRQQQALQQVQAERQQIIQRQAWEAQQRQAQTLNEAKAKLLEIVPEWRDPKVAKAERASLKEFGRSFGYSEEELAGITDHRAVALLRMAQKYQDLVQRRSTLKPVKRTVAPQLKPGPAAPKREARKVSELTRAKQSHAKIGSVASAAALFEKLL